MVFLFKSRPHYLKVKPKHLIEKGKILPATRETTENGWLDADFAEAMVGINLQCVEWRRLSRVKMAYSHLQLKTEIQECLPKLFLLIKHL